MEYKTSEGDSRKILTMVESNHHSKPKKQQFEIVAPRNGMLDDDTYNLRAQLEVESKSLWRIQNNYKTCVSADSESRRLWNLIEKDKQKIVRLLAEKVSERL